jgi:hypothetical protein
VSLSTSPFLSSLSLSLYLCVPYGSHNKLRLFP